MHKELFEALKQRSTVHGSAVDEKDVVNTYENSGPGPNH